MSFLEYWLAAPAAQALAWALAHFLWQGTAIALALAVSLGIARRSDSSLRYRIVAAALCLMPAAFIFTFVLCLPGDAAGAPRWIELNAARALGNAGLAPMPSDKGAGWMLWAVPVWAAGVLVMWVRTAGGWWAASRMARHGARPAPREWEDRMADLARRMGVARPVRLLESVAAGAPVVAGWLRPVILAPVGMLAGLAPRQVECILAHELAHVLRRDYLINVLQSLVEGLLFYHPAVWWVSSRLRAERENCCDDVAVRFTSGAPFYAAALAALEELRWSAPEPLLAARGGGLARRIRRLLGAEARTTRTPAGAMAALLLTALCCAAFAAWQPAQSDTKTPFDKWVEEDVAYIITKPERTAFLRLKDDAEREHFIEQFWKRRDPTPETPVNEFKEEHYRRIAYANSHFGASLPGWRTDRGRVYIMFGPPDEIESHPKGRNGGPPTESWRYHWIEGEGLGANVDFVFEDPGHTGEYRLKSPRWRA